MLESLHPNSLAAPPALRRGAARQASFGHGALSGAAARAWCLVLCAGLLGGCASTPAPLDQIRYFQQAFQAVDTVGQPLLDDLAIAERAQGQDVAVLRARQRAEGKGTACLPDDAVWMLAGDGKSGFIHGFCLGDAGYFSDLGDPPATERLRGGLRIVERYADVLAALAEGRNVNQALAQVDALAQDVAGLLALAGGAGAAALAPALGALRPLLEGAGRQAQADEARRLILDGAPRVTELIAALQAAAPEMFRTLIEAPAARAVRPAMAAGLPAELALIDSRRVAVAHYVVLLGKLQAAWMATVAAAGQPGGGRLAALVARTAALRADAEAVRKGLAALRAAGAR